MYSITGKWEISRTWPGILLGCCITALWLGIGLANAAPKHGKAGRTPNPVESSDPIPLPAGLAIPRYEPGPPPFRSGETLVYEASWLDIPAARATVTLLEDPRHSEWIGQVRVRSSKPLDVIYRMRDYVREDFRRDGLRPNDMYILQHDKRRLDEWTVKFDDPAHLVTSAKRNAEGRSWVRKFSGGEPWGPFSGAMLALSQPLEVGKTYTFDVFSGGSRYVFAFNVQKRERITTPLGTFDALRLEPSVVWLSRGEFLKQASETLIWVTDDPRHLPLRVEAATFVGSIRIDLVKVSNAPGPAPGGAGMTHVSNR